MFLCQMKIIAPIVFVGSVFGKINLNVKVGKGQRSGIDGPGYQWENNKLTTRHHKRETRGQPFHSTRPQGNNKQTHTKALQTHDRNNMNDLQKKYRLGTVSKIFYLRAKTITLSSNVDQYTLMFGLRERPLANQS